MRQDRQHACGDAAVVVVSTAIKETNPELVAARERGQEVIHRSQALALAAQGRAFVAVAGAHGKTTTSGMLAEALTAAGADPSFAIGGVVRALGTGAGWACCAGASCCGLSCWGLSCWGLGCLGGFWFCAALGCC